MKSPGSCALTVALACGAGFLLVAAHAATASFNIATTNVTMPGGGNLGISHFTLASINGYSGRLVVSSQYSGGDMNAKPPNCGIRTAPLYTLNANSTVSGSLTCYPYGKVVPVVQRHRPPANRAPPLVLAFAGWFILRRRLRATAARWLSLLVTGAIIAAGISACGGNGLSGNYPFTVTATDTATQASVSTSFTVTVP